MIIIDDFVYILPENFFNDEKQNLSRNMTFEELLKLGWKDEIKLSHEILFKKENATLQEITDFIRNLNFEKLVREQNRYINLTTRLDWLCGILEIVKIQKTTFVRFLFDNRPWKYRVGWAKGEAHLDVSAYSYVRKNSTTKPLCFSLGGESKFGRINF